ncbi:MAG: hypothetical protein ACJ73E_12135 [Mycobacteriales bacterium]
MGEPQEPREAWSEVGRRFEELGRKLRERFGDRDPGPAPGTAGAEGAAGAGTTGAGGAGQPEGRAALQDAVWRLREAAQRLGDRAGEVVRDPSMRETAQRATRSLADAVEATFGQLGEQLRNRSGAVSGAGRPAPAAPDPGRATSQPQAVAGPHPDPAPAEDPVGGEAPTRPPADS